MISAQILHESKTKWRVDDRTMEPWNEKSQIAEEYGLLPADARQQISTGPWTGL